MKKKSIFLLICFSLLVFIIGCGGSSKTPVEPPADPILSGLAKNLIPNGDFKENLEGDTEGWGSWVPYTESPSTNPTIEWRVDPDDPTNHYLYFTASNCGTAQWHQLITPYKKADEVGEGEPPYCEFVLQSGKEYFISLKAKSSSSGGRIHATLNHSPDVTKYYGGLVISTTTALKTYTKFIGVGNGEKVRFALSLGNLEAEAAVGGVLVRTNDNVEFYIDDSINKECILLSNNDIKCILIFCLAIKIIFRSKKKRPSH